MKRFRSEATLIVEEKYPSSKKVRAEHENDSISPPEEMPPSSTPCLHLPPSSRDHALSLVQSPCNTSNQQFLKKPKLGLDVDYFPCFLKASHAKSIFKQLEEELLTYFSTSQNEVVLVGKVHRIPRKHVAFGDPGLVYEFSGVRIPAKPWISVLESLRDLLTSVLGKRFNFVLVNRYKNGHDYIGEHRDNEGDLDPRSPIAALSLGQRRDFVFKHRDARGSRGTRKDIDVVKVCLEHGSLLVLNFPTNVYWYHSLPVRKSILGTRISLTYRVMKV